MPLYKLTYGASLVDSDATEVAEHFSLDLYPATAEGPFHDECRYHVTHEFQAPDNADAIRQAKEIIDESAADIDIFSLKGPDGEQFYSEEEMEEEED